MNRPPRAFIGDPFGSKPLLPMLFRIDDKFRTFGMNAGEYVEFYPAPDWNARVGLQILEGKPTRPGAEYFLRQKFFRRPPSGAITYQVRSDGTLLFLEENLP